MKILALLVIESVLGLNKPDAHKFLRSIIIIIIIIRIIDYWPGPSSPYSLFLIPT
jgi:hypothetical protein